MGAEFHAMTKAWLTRARNDLGNAAFTAEHRADLLDTVAYHCQQAGEKVVKAFLASQGLPIPKSHDVGKLVRLAAEVEPAFQSLVAMADGLTPLATEFRYPADDEAPMPTVQQCEEALAAAQRIYDFVLSVLPPETHPL